MDDELRRRARAARAEIEAQVDVESELAARPTTTDLAPITPLAPRRRIVAVAGSIAAVAIAVVGGVVLLRGSDSIETSEPTSPIGATTSIPSPSATPTTTVPGATTTVVPTTTAPGPTTTSTPAPTGMATVSYVDPPAATTLTPLGAVPAPDPAAGSYQMAIGDLGVAVLTFTYASETSRVDVIELDGATRSFDDVGFDNVLAYGPGDVVYSTIESESIEDFAVGAIPLSGDRVGEVIASEPADINRYLEYPPSSFGHGATGVTMRRDGGQVAIGYVDVDGNPITLDTAPTYYDGDTFRLDEGQVTVTASTGTSWSLSIDAHPDGASPFVGPSPAAPAAGGSGVFWSHIGPNLAPGVDFGEPSQWVIARLDADGSATWWSLPDGWTIAASDIWGTVAVRQTGEQLELALVDFAIDEVPASTTSTVAPAPTTTAPIDAAVPWQSLPWEATRIERNCIDEDSGCTQLMVDRDGSIVTYVPSTRTLTRHITPPVEAVLPAPLADGSFLWHLGPDDVVYLGVPNPTDEFESDVVAVTLSPDDSGRELARWSGVIGTSGDSELVVTRDGLVVVGCCDHELLRPAPDAELVLRWVGRDGGDVSVAGPVMRTEVEYPTLTVHRDDDLPAGTRSWTFQPPADWQPRGMPTVIPTFDGGFIATTYGTQQSVIRGWVDGTIKTITVDMFEFPTLDPNGRATIADDDRFARFEPFADRAEFWAGRPEIGDDGTVTLPDIDTPIDFQAGWARNPITFGNAVAGRVAVNERRTIEYERPGESEFVVTVTTSNFFDDSVFASRLELTLNRDDDGRFRFVSGQWAQACQPGRGHQGFSPGLCI
jgi:hypothetical protein